MRKCFWVLYAFSKKLVYKPEFCDFQEFKKDHTGFTDEQWNSRSTEKYDNLLYWQKSGNAQRARTPCADIINQQYCMFWSTAKTSQSLRVYPAIDHLSL